MPASINNNDRKRKSGLPQSDVRLGFPKPVFCLGQQRAVNALLIDHINLLLQSGEKCISIQLHFPF